MSVGAIPWAAIDAYGRSLGYDDVDLEDFHYIMRRIDAGYMEMMNERSKRV